MAGRFTAGLLVVALACFGTAALAHDGAAATTRLKIWFSNLRLNPDPSDCRAVYLVERLVPRTVAVATASLNALFAGPTPAEAARGYHSAFSSASAGLLKSIRISRGSAFVDLQDLRTALSTVSSSCGAAEFQAQLTTTMLQFSSVKRLSLAIDGQPQRLHDWLNLSCAPAGAACDALAFQRGP